MNRIAFRAVERLLDSGGVDLVRVCQNVSDDELTEADIPRANFVNIMLALQSGAGVHYITADVETCARRVREAARRRQAERLLKVEAETIAAADGDLAGRLTALTERLTALADGAKVERRSTVLWMNDVQPKPVRWLWNP